MSREKKERERERERLVDYTAFYDLVFWSYTITFTLLFIRNKSLMPTHTQGEDIIQMSEHQEAVVTETILELATTFTLTAQNLYITFCILIYKFYLLDI